jgi:hypothetical protein
MGLGELINQFAKCINCPFISKCEKSEDRIRNAGYVDPDRIFTDGLDIRPPFESHHIQSRYFDDRRKLD